jgi:hypothetical protein
MYELVYCSQAKPNMVYEDILNILKISRERNIKNNITGCLLFYNNQFVQIIEGEKDRVQELYEKIKTDTRHKNLLLLAQSHKKERHFPNWKMAFQRLKSSDFENFFDENLIDNFNAFADLAEKPTVTIHFFWSMVKRIIDNDLAKQRFNAV